MSERRTGDDHANGVGKAVRATWQSLTRRIRQNDFEFTLPAIFSVHLCHERAVLG